MLASGRKRNKRFSARPSSGGGSGAFTISRRANISIHGSSVSGLLALTLAAWFGGGLDGRGGCPAAGSTALLGWRLLRLLRGSGGGGGGRVEAAAARWGRMCRIASVCFCAAENCWAKFSTVSPNRLVWDTGAFRNRALSTSFMSARHSQRWRSWTTMVDIARPRERAVTFVARSARAVAVRSSLRTHGS